MAYCRNCGAALVEGKKFCSECGEPTGEAPARASIPAPEIPVRQPIPIEYPAEKPKRKRKSLFRRWWFWVLVIVVAVSLWNRSGGRTNRTSSTGRSEPVTTTAPRSTPRPTVSPTEMPDEADDEAEPEASSEPETTPEPTEAPLSQSDIRPEFREYMDAYEEFMDEYIEFMERYSDADPSSAALMLYDYYRLMERYEDFAEALDAMDESDYTHAEWAYYLEVTNRVNQKLLRSLG
jgi:predicted nucleic acid-binding Zn ribbon protein